MGYEFRHDEIASIPNDVAREGLLWGFFKDLGAVGEKDTKEYFAEVEVPVLANVPAAEELTVNVSTRHTDDEFYGGAWTYSSKLAWRPVESLLLRGTVGTSVNGRRRAVCDDARGCSFLRTSLLCGAGRRAEATCRTL